MLKIYNTLSRKKECFKPLHEQTVSVYACGVTVYDFCHIGHARTYISADVIIRYLRFLGYTVNYVRNITDIDDKIIKRANESNEDYTALTKRFTKAMHEDFDALALTPPNHEPHATQHVTDIIDLISKILKEKHAYIAQNGDVYFSVRDFKNYGQLSHRNIDQLESGARVEVVEAKQDPLDFVLWKLAKPNEPSWDSPWGKGRPGWHIECSAMSMKCLGEYFDIHLGGRDLIFPHHENELAQSQAATHQPFVKIWMHAGFVQVEKEKMSKSLGNFITIREFLADHDPEVLRYLFVASHYRSPLTYSSDLLQQAKQSLTRLYSALRYLPQAVRTENTDFELRFIAAMNDDFNSPVALSVLFELAHEIQRIRELDEKRAASLGALLKYLANQVLGLVQADPELFFQSGASVDIARIEKLIAARNAARQEKNWVKADQIRAALASMSIVIEDGANGTTWKSVAKKD